MYQWAQRDATEGRREYEGKELQPDRTQGLCTGRTKIVYLGQTDPRNGRWDFFLVEPLFLPSLPP